MAATAQQMAGFALTNNLLRANSSAIRSTKAAWA
jgi:hypothetical protein